MPFLRPSSPRRRQESGGLTGALDDARSARTLSGAASRGVLSIRGGGFKRGAGCRCDFFSRISVFWVLSLRETKAASGASSRSRRRFRQQLFCTISHGTGFGSTLDSSYVRRVLPRLAAQAGLERRDHPHALRHSLATALAHEGKPLPAITAQLGHSSTAVTDRYLAKIAPADLVQQIRDRGRLDL